MAGVENCMARSSATEGTTRFNQTAEFALGNETAARAVPRALSKLGLILDVEQGKDD